MHDDQIMVVIHFNSPYNEDAQTCTLKLAKGSKFADAQRFVALLAVNRQLLQHDPIDQSLPEGFIRKMEIAGARKPRSKGIKADLPPCEILAECFYCLGYYGSGCCFLESPISGQGMCIKPLPYGN